MLTPSDRKDTLQIIHTAAPWWSGKKREIVELRSCYRNSLRIVTEQAFERVAFPLIGSGERGFPKELALRVATEETAKYLDKHPEVQIILVIHDKNDFQPDAALLEGLQRYIVYTKKAEKRKRKQQETVLDQASTEAFSPVTEEELDHSFGSPHVFQFPDEEPQSAITQHRPPDSSVHLRHEEPAKAKKPRMVLPFGTFRPERGAVLDESFSQMVLRKIDENGFEKDSDCYNKANLDRRLFSRIRCDENYHPKKTTALALAIALKLSLNETNELLMKAGYSLSHSILFDVIVEYCILQRIYNIYEVNELLFQYDQPLLGG